MTVDEIVRDLLLSDNNPSTDPNTKPTPPMQEQNQQKHVPNTLERVVDIGTQVFNLKAERTRKGTFVTAYCSAITVRSCRLEIPRVLDTFIDAVVLVCGLDDDAHDETAAQLEDDLRAFVREVQDTL